MTVNNFSPQDNTPRVASGRAMGPQWIIFKPAKRIDEDVTWARFCWSQLDVRAAIDEAGASITMIMPLHDPLQLASELQVGPWGRSKLAQLRDEDGGKALLAALKAAGPVV